MERPKGRPVSQDRGVRLQRALATYLRHWYERAESNPNGRSGRDILNTPGAWFECKTESLAVMCKRKGGPASYIRQAQSSVTDSTEPPVVIWWPPGVGAERPNETIAMLPTPWLMRLLVEAGYAPGYRSDR